jgi:outer membrane protein assembly factor BamD
MIEEFEKGAAAAYSKVITRYPAMDRALDAKARLEALKQPVPRPTRAALELNKKEVASRREQSMVSSVMGTFTKRPDMARATRVGEPTMVDPTPVNATDVVRRATLASGGGKGGADTKLGAQVVSVNPAANQEPPRSDTPSAAVADPPVNVADPTVAAPSAAEQPAPQAEAPVAGELVPNVAADPSTAKPDVAADPTALPPPQQNNELANGSPAASASSSSSAQKADDLVDISSSKKKKKKGIGKINPF